MTNNEKRVGKKTKEFLMLAGFKEKEISSFSGEMQLYNDLKWDGDDALDYLLVLESKFSIDLSKLELKKYFHSEGELLEPFPIKWAKWIMLRYFGIGEPPRKLRPLTFDMIEQVLEAKEWIFD